MTEEICVLIGDSQPVVISGLEAIISAERDLKLAGKAENSEELLSCCAQDLPDVILTDLAMFSMEGAPAVKRIRARHPQARVMVFTSVYDFDLVQTTLAAGATGYLLKNARTSNLVTAIRAVHKGQITLSPEITQTLVQNTICPANNSNLTERELTVLGLITSGLTNYQIALQLNISLSTVQFHVSNILSKLGVCSRVQAALLAERHNLLSRAGIT